MLALVALVAALVAVVARAPTAAGATLTAGGAVAIDGPALFLQGALIVLGIVALLLIGERSLEHGGPFVAQAAITVGTEADRQQAAAQSGATEVYPLTLFALGRHDAVRLRERPADHVRRARGLLAAAVPAVRAGPPPAAAQPGGGAQVLPARRVRLGVLPVRHGAGLRLRRRGRRSAAIHDAATLGATNSHAAALRRPGPGRRSACCSRSPRCRSTSGRPDVYQGAPTPVTAFMAACTKVAAFGGAAAGALRRRSTGSAGTIEPVLGTIAVLTMLVGAILAVTQTDIKRLLAYSSIANAGYLLVGVLGVQRGRACPARCSTWSPTASR